MEGQFSKPSSSSNPSSPSTTNTTSDMSSSNSSQTQESNLENEPINVSESPESQSPVKESSDPPADGEIKEEGEGGEEGEEEEEGECGFCLFMKGGGCKDEFIEWEKCVEEGEKNNEDISVRCFEITGSLKKCMEAHRDYYAPLLRAEEEAMKELEEKAKEKEEATNESDKEKKSDELGSTVQASNTDTNSEEKVKGSP
ncbi:hypothetical protein M9H77_09934 [Catharanthus roseus]|uniref:Uncharacterized protein n=1 Tax=Catharanthus roseus TaxID=4058 RepID=A0ACC0C264_CATRO|nr:hypothetical protein M9H77_09934 [Catharanthus roseus]